MRCDAISKDGALWKAKKVVKKHGSTSRLVSMVILLLIVFDYFRVFVNSA